MGGQQGGGAQVRALLLAARQRQNYACLGATASPCKPSAVTSGSRRLGCFIAAGARQQRGRCAARPPPVHQGARLSVGVCPVLSQPRPTCMLCLVCCAARRRRCCWRRAWRSSRCAGRCTDLFGCHCGCCCCCCSFGLPAILCCPCRRDSHCSCCPSGRHLRCCTAGEPHRTAPRLNTRRAAPS